MSAVLLFAELGERASRAFLSGWTGPLVPEAPTREHDHRKQTLTWTDCQGPDVLEGCVLTFTQSQWCYGTELVFEDGLPRGQGEDHTAGRRVLGWATAWRWITDAGLDLDRFEVRAQAARVVARVLRLPFSDAAPVLYRHRSGLWYLEEPRIAAPLGVWSATGLPVHAAGDDALPVLPLLSDGATAGQAWRALLLALRQRIAALGRTP